MRKRCVQEKNCMCISSAVPQLRESLGTRLVMHLESGKSTGVLKKVWKNVAEKRYERCNHHCCSCFQDAVVDHIFELLLEFFSVHAHSIAFPEVALPAVVRVSTD